MSRSILLARLYWTHRRRQVPPAIAHHVQHVEGLDTEHLIAIITHHGESKGTTKQQPALSASNNATSVPIVRLK